MLWIIFLGIGVIDLGILNLLKLKNFVYGFIFFLVFVIYFLVFILVSDIDIF